MSNSNSQSSLQNHFKINGLTSEQVLAARARFGNNKLEFHQAHPLWTFVKEAVKDPMVILLLCTSLIYFVGGQIGDGFFLTAALVFILTISGYQDNRNRKALAQLQDQTQPKCKVIRNGALVEIHNSELVIGDCLWLEEGNLIWADAKLVQAHDFSVNESIITGESMPVMKNSSGADLLIYSGTTVTTGWAIGTVVQIGNQTEIGKIGSSLSQINIEKTPLEQQIAHFVVKMAWVGLAIFLMVWVVNYLHSQSFILSLLRALTLAMSILPEEIPVAFTTFMALGAWRLMQTGCLVKQMKTVETLGSATVICTDKTGTLTQNQMSLTQMYALGSLQATSLEQPLSAAEKRLLTTAMWASEPHPFDPMEVALHRCYEDFLVTDERPHYQLIHEYPLMGQPPMMTHIFQNIAGHRIIAAKGAPEALMAISNLTELQKEKIHQIIAQMAAQGYRILGVGSGHTSETVFPEKQNEFNFEFLGLLAFYDPPKKNITQVLQGFYQAGIGVKIITGDHTLTTQSLAQKIGFIGYQECITGDQLMKLSQSELRFCVKTTYIFTRMFPEAKLRIINALKENHEIVAMTGDGVNDAPALKSAHIGIAMGKKGSEIAKQAASLILMEDDLSKMIDAVAMGRRIYMNLKKAIQYIISIHIPILLIVFVPLVLDWVYPNIFSPIHIIFLEMIMGPTCSIIYEREPIEKNTMQQKPRPFTKTFFNGRELWVSIIQGLVIAAGTLVMYQYSVGLRYDLALTRTMVFTVLMTANIMLTLENRSLNEPLIKTIRYKNNLIPLVVFVTLSLLGLLLYWPPLTHFFELKPLSGTQLFSCCAVGIICVLWFEIIKVFKKNFEANTYEHNVKRNF